MKRGEQLKFAMEEIYSMFEPYLDKPNPENPVTFIDATVFHDKLGGVVSKPTILRAKDALGIQSVKIEGHYRWRFPKKTPDSVMQSLHDHRLGTLERLAQAEVQGIKEAYRPSVSMLKDRMEASFYNVLAREILIEFESCGYNRKTALRAKKILHVLSIKRTNGWHWIWPAPPVREWLEKRLRTGPVSLDTLLYEAQQKKWSPDLIRLTRMDLGGIKNCWINRRQHWYDMNSTSLLGDGLYVDKHAVAARDRRKEARP